MNRIEVKNVNKSFQGTPVLKQINLTLEEGKIYGLLGRNGAGKSTLLNVINNRLFADSGEIRINGRNAVENDRAQGNLYFMTECSTYPKDMTVKRVFRWTKEFYGGFDDAYAAYLADLFQLNVKKKVGSLSTGYSSIYKIITALCVDVPYVFLDEPVLGLDANHRDMFYKILMESYLKKPRTIVISTHLIEEIASLLEHVIIIKDGSIIRDQSCEELTHSGFTVSGKTAEVDAFLQVKEVIGADVIGGLKTAYVLGQVDQPAGDLEISPLDLQKLFIQLTASPGGIHYEN